MIRFDCDYLEGAHPKILRKIVDTNYEQTPGYGNDIYTKSAISKIRKLCNKENIDVHIVSCGTQVNLVAISSALKPYQGVICVDTGHINVHEAGAIEATGHKVIITKNKNGKITSNDIDKIMKDYINDGACEHMVMPKMVFISFPTECGTNYTKDELKSIYDICKKYSLYLYIDGARLGYGLVSKDTDINTLEDISDLCDMFCIGGTKCGALFGEALIIINDNLKIDFRHNMKQRGALLAKGRMLGIQFDVLMENDLYFKICKNAVELAMKLKKALLDKGYKLLYDSYSNQQFVIINNDKLNELEKDFSFFKWKIIDENNTAVRICTSWATVEENVDKLIEKL